MPFLSSNQWCQIAELVNDGISRRRGDATVDITAGVYEDISDIGVSGLDSEV